MEERASSGPSPEGLRDLSLWRREALRRFAAALLTRAPWAADRWREAATATGRVRGLAAFVAWSAEHPASLGADARAACGEFLAWHAGLRALDWAGLALPLDAPLFPPLRREYDAAGSSRRSSAAQGSRPRAQPAAGRRGGSNWPGRICRGRRSARPGATRTDVASPYLRTGRRERSPP